MPQIHQSAAEMLLGRPLERGWRVTERVPRHPAATGGTFSVGYIVEHPDGKRGLCKALDYLKAFSQPTTPDALHLATEQYIFERNLHQKCDTYKMSKIITALDDGYVMVPECIMPRVDYIIFELADSDVRHQLNLEPDLKAAFRFRALHHVTVALRQLHQHGIAHQDVKPSNVLSCAEAHADKVHKLGDLGRATDMSMPALHDGIAIPGDRNYAPPEHLYGLLYPDFMTRRCASDIYQLGSLATFMFTGMTMNSLLFSQLAGEYSWRKWNGTYDEVLPYIESAFADVIDMIALSLPFSFSDEFTRLIQCLCEPNPLRRGHPKTRSEYGSPFALQRVITQFDRLAMSASRPVLAEVS